MERDESHKETEREIMRQLEKLSSATSSSAQHREWARDALVRLSKLAENDEAADVMVELGVIPHIVSHLQTPTLVEGEPMPFELEVEQASSFSIGVIAAKRKHQQVIVDSGALPHLVDLLKRRTNGSNSKAVASVIKRAADAITNISKENTSISTRVRIEGGIPPLVKLLQSQDQKVQNTTTRTLRTLAAGDDENITQIIEFNALPSFLRMLESQDIPLNYEALRITKILVHSPNIRGQVIAGGALYSVIRLLSSPSRDCQREAAFLVGLFAAADADTKIRIAQSGALHPLIQMLRLPDIEAQKLSAFALGKLAQDSHNQIGIVLTGGLDPLLSLMKSENQIVQHNAVFTLYGLANNKDNVADFITLGVVQNLTAGEFITERRTKHCVADILGRLQEGIHGRVLHHLLDIMRAENEVPKQRVALALAHLCSPKVQKTIFIDKGGLRLVLDALSSSDYKIHRDSCLALLRLADKAGSLVDAAPPSPAKVFMGQEFINNPALSDVTFFVEGRRFYARRTCLRASDVFTAMIAGNFRERDAAQIEIHDITWEVFESMMRYIHTGSLDVEANIARDLLEAANKYLLFDLKLLCEQIIAKDISEEDVDCILAYAERHYASSLKDSCIFFVLKNHNKLWSKSWYPDLIKETRLAIRDCFPKLLTRPTNE